VISIRSYESRDAGQLAHIFRESVEVLAPKFYNTQQVAAWSVCGADEHETDRRCRDGRFAWVATNDTDMPVAFIDLKSNGYIDMLYCHPSHAGKGVASELFKALETKARILNMQTLTTDASAVAEPVFRHWGFETIRRNEFERDGVQIFNYLMSKQIL
jgi:putative acetyltransferase